uniref:Uncharacterized protein n=1 Tax=Lupinus angustifolius TaxID=3871 RepID=L0P0Z4_LUPAN|nr:hypothetical protein [Lupinus angustifolius]
MRKRETGVFGMDKEGQPYVAVGGFIVVLAVIEKYLYRGGYFLLQFEGGKAIGKQQLLRRTKTRVSSIPCGEEMN